MIDKVLDGEQYFIYRTPAYAKDRLAMRPRVAR